MQPLWVTTIKANKSTQRHPLFRTSIARSKSLPVVTAFSARCHRAAVRSGLELCRRRNAIVHNPRRAAGRLDTPSTWCGQVTGIRRAAFKGFVECHGVRPPSAVRRRQRTGSGWSGARRHDLDRGRSHAAARSIGAPQQRIPRTTASGTVCRFTWEETPSTSKVLPRGWIHFVKVYKDSSC